MGEIMGPFICPFRGRGAENTFDEGGEAELVMAEKRRHRFESGRRRIPERRAMAVSVHELESHYLSIIARLCLERPENVHCGEPHECPFQDFERSSLMIHLGSLRNET